MLSSLDSLQTGFSEVAAKSRRECGDTLEKLRRLVFIVSTFNRSIVKCVTLGGEKYHHPKYANSLVLLCHYELPRISGHILFFSINGLYRNAFNNIRYVIESIVQSMYIELRHPEASLEVKLEILKEVEDKTEYHARRLIDKLEIPHKDALKRKYKELSQRVHPSHRQVVATFKDIYEPEESIPARIDCREILRIHESVKEMLDIFYFLFASCFPEVKKFFHEDVDVVKSIKAYGFRLLSGILKV